ncbi:DUF4244 domain-containing protein, partial [Leucobacter sp. M11]|uniref:DUF4244 domain-containing protein n=1 Tax=Leucobacter sp. M11 TaxID=2993565 RepID=UPI002D7E3363
GTLPGSSPEPHSAPTPAPVSARKPGRWRGLARRLRGALGNESGAATAEYAVVIMAAVGFAGLLVIIMQSDEVRGFLVGLVQRALGSAG